MRGEGEPGADVVIINKAPTGWDVHVEKPMLDPDGRSLRTALLRQGIPAYWTTAVPFFRKNMKPTKAMADAAAPIIQAELERLGATKVILLGVNSARWTPQFGVKFARFSEVGGRTIRSNGIDFRCLPALTVIANVSGQFRLFLEQLEELINPKEREVLPPARQHYRTITNKLQAKQVLSQLSTLVACDIESTGLDPWSDRILTIQFSDTPGTGIAVPFDLLTIAEWQDVFDNKRLVMQNGTFDTKFLMRQGILTTVHQDTMLMHSLIDETPGTHNMDGMAQRFLGIDKWSDMVDYDALEEMPVEDLGIYGARDADITLRLFNDFFPRVEGLEVNKVLHEAQNAITRSEVRGIKIDREKAIHFAEEVEIALYSAEERLADVYGLENANSPAQVARFLYKELGLPVQKNKGKVTTDTPHIEPFADSFPAVRDILEIRHLTKVDSTYVQRILEESRRDGRYHPDFALARTETGRVSERLITLIPRSDDQGDVDLGKQFQLRLRELFIPDDGYLMVGADYSALEVRMAAYLCKDPALLDDMDHDRDIHSINAIAAFGLDIDLQPYATLKKRVSQDHTHERTLAKIATFASLYGGSAAAISLQTGLDITTSQSLIDTLYARYPRLSEWQRQTQQYARTHGFVETPWGRRRRFSFGVGMKSRVEEEQLRQAINTPIQSHASDMTLRAFAGAENGGLETLFPLHDAIYIQAPEDKAEKAAQELKKIMERVITGHVEFTADVKIGESWAALG